MPLMYQESRTREEEQEEKQELQAVLQSGLFSKAPNLQHFLAFVGEKYFAGRTEEAKEYSIAVQALNRPADFDPQSDTIVRVTAHALRKRLEQYYANEGAGHAVQLQLPPGKYVLRFFHKPDFTLLNRANEPGSGEYVPPVEPDPFRQRWWNPDRPWSATGPWSSRRWSGWAARVAVAAAALLTVFGIYWGTRRQSPQAARVQDPVRIAEVAQDSTIRMLFGENRQPYVDAAGQAWRANQYCQGGSSFSHPDRDVQGTDDPAIFREGREGKFHCRIPAAPGVYQLQLLFADTAGDKEAARQVDFSINHGPTEAVDVVDEAGGSDIALGKVYAGIRPERDGTIHLDFSSDGAFLNAAELTGTASESGMALRMVAGPAVFRGRNGEVWLPERFFTGGRRTFHPDNLPKTANAKLFEWERYGHFHYFLPVVPGREYSVKLYFSEGWFGAGNGGPGGAGSRVFDVYCNGTTLLSHFDILREQQGGTVTVTARHVKPTSRGMLELYFTPVTNYPLINAIEVDPEG